MSRDEGFAVMDVSTSIVNDPKVRRLFRHAPDLGPSGFTAYTATLAESWRAGRRVTVEDAWPSFLPFDRLVVEALTAVGLLDGNGAIPSKSWRGWFEPAQKRRANTRDRWRRANDARHDLSTNNRAVTASQPRGDSADTVAIPSVPSVPSVKTYQGVDGGTARDPEKPRLVSVEDGR